LTPELIERVARVVRAGNYLDTAARYCGVSKVDFYAWMKRGHAQKRGIYREFLNALEEAQAAADVRDHALIAKAAEKDWRAAAEHLRLRNQARYGMRRVEVTGADGGPVEVRHLAGLSTDEVLALARRLLSDGDGGEED
jgi:hypothetical protein